MKILSMVHQTLLLGFLALVAVVEAETTCQLDPPPGTPVPQLKLPWGTWTATCYQHDNHIFLFRDVRFGAIPERFSRPTSPDWPDDTVQNNNQNISCIQVDVSQLRHPPGGKPYLGDPNPPEILQREDCLFLDIYVPVSAFQSEAELLPVVVWFFGGAYAYGSKNPSGPLNTGQSILNASDYQVIFITGNYRVGTFGWLAGDYMQEVGQPNAGLYDQALLLEWVRDYVHLVQGDKDHVSAWGESAGAGSILHHLIREDGKHDPLFSTFAVQSPAFQWAWNNTRDGELDAIYKTFSNLSGCGYGYDINCLRNAPRDIVESANTRLFNQIRLEGFFPVGPAVDGKWIKSIPTVSFSQKKYWQGVESAIISHCANEAMLFTPNISTSEEFDEFLHEFLPSESLENEITAIKEKYTCTDGDYLQCLATVIRDSMFTCNTRDLFDAFPKMSYMMRYEFPNAGFAVHATDLIPLFVNSRQEIVDLLNSLLKESADKWWVKLVVEGYATLLDHIPKIYQNYFASFALTGDPNTGLVEPEVPWPIADGSGDELSGVLNIGLKEWDRNIDTISDDQNAKSICSFWTEIADNITHVLQVDVDAKERVPLQMGSEEL
ncbi:hypothetical protein Hte_010542 [Hypoxylon texense]